MRKGFTLSEVLLVLSVIGVVAALTIPTLIQKTSKDQYVSQLKKEYSVLSQAFNLLQAENGGSIVPVFQNDTPANGGNGIALNAFLSKLNVIKNCGNAMGCWYDKPRYLLDGTLYEATPDTSDNGKNGKAILADGTMINMGVRSVDCTYNNGSGPFLNTCGYMDVDINGAAGPNVRGRDYFVFFITQSGIYPRGTTYDAAPCNVPPGDYGNTIGCTGKVLTEGAMNY